MGIFVYVYTFQCIFRWELRMKMVVSIQTQQNSKIKNIRKETK